MVANRFSQLDHNYLEALRGAAAAFPKVGNRRRINKEVKKLAVSAAISGIPNAKIIEALKIGWSTLHKWKKQLEPTLLKSGLIEPVLKPANSIVQTLEISEQVETQPTPLTVCRGIEIRVGDVFIRVAQGGAI